MSERNEKTRGPIEQQLHLKPSSQGRRRHLKHQRAAFACSFSLYYPLYECAVSVLTLHTRVPARAPQPFSSVAAMVVVVASKKSGVVSMGRQRNYKRNERVNMVS
jgi:hypothetical protein